jgi:hypothetical protein
MPYVGHPLFEAAREAARVRADYQADFGQNDWLGEAVLALVEGRDPEEAVRAFRRREAAYDKRCVHTFDLSTLGLSADGRVIVGAREGDIRTWDS